MSFLFRWEFLQLNRLLSTAPGPTPPGLAGADVRPLSVRGSCSMDIWSSDRVPKPCTTRRTLATPAQRSRGGVHHSGRCRKGSTRRNPPRPTDNEQPIQHTPMCIVCISSTANLASNLRVDQRLCNGGRRRKTHASSCISLSNPMVRSTSALYRSARLKYLAPPPTWHQGHACQHLRPRKLRGNCVWPKSVPP